MNKIELLINSSHPNIFKYLVRQTKKPYRLNENSTNQNFQKVLSIRFPYVQWLREPNTTEIQRLLAM